MAGGVVTEPRSGLKDMSDFVDDESGWADELVSNFRTIGRLAVPNLYIKDRDLTAPPGSPADGDAYIPAATATGDWVGLEDKVVIWDDTVPAWVSFTPMIGWVTYIEDEEVLSAYKAGGWSAGIAI